MSKSEIIRYKKDFGVFLLVGKAIKSEKVKLSLPVTYRMGQARQVGVINKSKTFVCSGVIILLNWACKQRATFSTVVTISSSQLREGETPPVYYSPYPTKATLLPLWSIILAFP